MAKLAEVREEIAALSKAQVDAYEQYPDYDFPDDVVSEVEQRNAKLLDLQAQFKTLQDREAIGRAAQAVHDDMTRPVGGLPFPSGRGDGKAATELLERKSAGQQVFDDPEYKTWYEQVTRNGHVSEKMKLDSPAVKLPGGFKTLVTGASATSGGAMVFPDIQAGLVQLPFRPLTIRDIITIGQTNSDTIEYVRVTGYTNAAAAVAEATAATGTTGTKPESALALEKVTAPIKTIAHWIPATTRALADAPQMRTLIDAFLRDGLMQVLEDEILTGDASGEHFDGVGHVTGTQSQAFDTDLLTTLRKARTLVRVVGRATPTAFVMHPNDWVTVDLLQDNEARYYASGPREISSPRIWGLNVVESEACPEGTAYVADWKTVVLFDREQTSIQVSNQHSDYFVRNLIAILAELRAGLAILRPAAIVEVDLTA
jgi:HK97 family phage major capsid protein